MSVINITNIQILNNPAPVDGVFTFRITFECLRDISDGKTLHYITNLQEIEWKLIYVGSSKDEGYDQALDSFSMGPLQYGVMQFDLESSPPDFTKIPKEEFLGVTAIILSVSFREQEFFRVGYYVYNAYTDPELNENPPEEIQYDKVARSILADKPRITRFDIKWGDNNTDEIILSTDAHTPDIVNEDNQINVQVNPFLTSDYVKNPMFEGIIPTKEEFN